MMGMQIEAYDYEVKQDESLKSTEKADRTIDDVANQPVDSKTESEMRSLSPFFRNVSEEKKLFQSAFEKSQDNSDLNARVSKLEEKVKMMESLQMGLEGQIGADPELSALLDRGSVNYNPEAMGKEVLFNEGASVEASNG